MSITKASLIDLNGQELILDADADTSITADTDDQIDIKIAGSDVITLTSATSTFNTGVIFNESSADLDFRVESDARAYGLFVDGGTSAVSIGVAPRSDVHSTWAQLFLGEKGSLISENLSSGGNYGMHVSDNLYVDSDTGAFAYITADEASLYTQEAGTHKFFNVASGSAGAAATTTERWRISSTGVLTSGGNSAVNIGGTPADANFAELGAGYINLARDDTADADQILFGKNGAIHSKITTSASGLTVGSIGNLNAFVNAGTSGSNVLDLQSGGTTRVRVQNSGLEVNPSGLSSGDLIAQSDNNTHMLFVDASADAVGVGVSDPAGLPLHLKVSSGDNKLRQETASKDAFTLGLDNSTGDTIIGTNSLYPHVRFLNAGGICFGSDTADANALDDYEESSFNTILSGSTSGTHSTSGSGRLTKIGRLASVLLAVDNVNSSSVSGELRISLPIAYAGHDMYLPVQVYNLNYPDNTKTAYAYVSNGYTYVILYWSRDNNTSLAIVANDLNTGSYIRCNFNYPTS